MAWYTGKSSINVLSFGDSNMLGAGGFQPGVQTYNANNRFYITDTSVPYNTDTLAYRQLSNDSTSQYDTVVEVNEETLYVGQVCGGNGSSTMQLADTVQTATSIPVYTCLLGKGGSTAAEWLFTLWDDLVSIFAAALEAAPGSPSYADVFYISNGGADLLWGSPRALEILPNDPRNFGAVPPSAQDWYSLWFKIRGRLIDEGFWLPGVTQILIQEIPRGSEIPAYPAWQGLQYAISRTPDRIKLISSVGRTYDPVWPIHFSPQSYTDMGSDAGEAVIAQVPNQQSIVSVGGQRLSIGGQRLGVKAA